MENSIYYFGQFVITNDSLGKRLDCLSILQNIQIMRNTMEELKKAVESQFVANLKP